MAPTTFQCFLSLHYTLCNVVPQMSWCIDSGKFTLIYVVISHTKVRLLVSVRNKIFYDYVCSSKITGNRTKMKSKTEK